MTDLNQPNDNSQNSIELTNLDFQQLQQIDQALRAIGDYGEVHLVKVEGRLRVVRKISSEDASRL